MLVRPLLQPCAATMQADAARCRGSWCRSPVRSSPLGISAVRGDVSRRRGRRGEMRRRLSFGRFLCSLDRLC